MLYAQGCIDSRDGNDQLRESSLRLCYRRRSCCAIGLLLLLHQAILGLLYRRRPGLAGDVFGGSLPLNGLGFCARHGFLVYVLLRAKEVKTGMKKKSPGAARVSNTPRTDRS